MSEQNVKNIERERDKALTEAQEARLSFRKELLNAFEEIGNLKKALEIHANHGERVSTALNKIFKISIGKNPFGKIKKIRNIIYNLDLSDLF
jgi:hypothetical protein